MLAPAQSLDELYRGFAWELPERFSLAHACCDRHAAAGRDLAVLAIDEAGRAEPWSFARVRAQSCRLAHLLRARGISAGHRIGILLDQRPETLLAHLAASRLGAVALPLFRLFGPDALRYRLSDSGAAALITDREGAVKLAAIRDALPDLRLVLSVDGPSDGAEALGPLMERASDAAICADTAAEDPAILIYTSGTTGNPKGALHAARVLLGHLPGVQMPHELFPKPGDRFWTPADWAWIGGLLDVLLPSLFFGVPVVAARLAKFEPERAADLMARHKVRNAFMPPTALKLMRAAGIDAQRRGASLRSMGSGGESLGADLLDWVRTSFGIAVNEFYGQTECNLVVANIASLATPVPGAMGWPVPGHEVAVIDDDGRPLPEGEAGMIAVKRPDPVMFLRYWNNEGATRAKFNGDWLLTGDVGRRDGEGRFWYAGRDDDLITSAGYRIGPAEVEACIGAHPAVALCAVVGVPDPVRGQAVKAFVVVREGVEAGEALAAEIQNRVKAKLGAHEYPRAVAFVPDLPLTATGKIMRRALREGEDR